MSLDNNKASPLNWLLKQIANPNDVNLIKKVKVGFLIDDFFLIRPFETIVRHLAETGFVEIVLVVKRADARRPSTKSRGGWLGALWRQLKDPFRRKRFFWRLFTIVDHQLYAEETKLDLVPVHDLLAKIPTVEVSPISKGFDDYFCDEDLSKIRTFEPDVLLRFGFRILKGEVLSLPRYGIWSYHHGDEIDFRGSPPLFWECSDACPSVGVMLQRLTDQLDFGQVLCRGKFANLNSISMLKNQVDPYWTSTHFVVSALKQLALGDQRIIQSLNNQPITKKKNSVRRPPLNAEFLLWLAPTALKKLTARALGRSRNAKWKIGLRRGSMSLLDDYESVAFEDFVWVEAPKGNFWADPSLIDYNDSTLIFFEEYVGAQSKGRICCGTLSEDLKVNNVRVVLEAEHHLSFPHVFYDSGNWYLIPESAQVGRVDLYVAKSFPFDWIRVDSLIQQPCVDSVVVAKDGKYFLLTTLQTGFGPASLQLVFCADSLVGPWKLHPQAPVSSDYRIARNGGATFNLACGTLARVSQSAENNYGSQFSIHRINRLTDTEFEEELFKTIEADKTANMKGTHSLSISKHFVAVDGLWFTEK
jgi:hypothetical protein